MFSHCGHCVFGNMEIRTEDLNIRGIPSHDGPTSIRTIPADIRQAVISMTHGYGNPQIVRILVEAVDGTLHYQK